MPDEDQIAERIEELLAEWPGRLLNASQAPNSNGQKAIEAILEAARSWVEQRVKAGQGDTAINTPEPDHASG